MIRGDIKQQVDAERSAGFPDLERMVALLCELVDDRPDPDLNPTENAHAW